MNSTRSPLIHFLAFAGLIAMAAPAALGATQSPDTSSHHSESYPLDTCVVSGEKLGTMGKPFDYVHRQAGQPDRLVRFCCRGCVKDFKKNPATYLKLLDEAAAQSKT